LLLIDELGDLPFEKRTANPFFQFVARYYDRGSMLLTNNQMLTQSGHVVGDEMTAAAVVDTSDTTATPWSSRATATASQKKRKP
jgi:DNA replication protein DnaC